VFPWDAGAAPGARFSASHVPPASGRGRFDLPVEVSPVLYAAVTPDHAVAELLQPWRGRPLEPSHLSRAGLPLAMVEVKVPPASARRLADLCDPSYLAAVGIGPDTTASRVRAITQPIARVAWDAGRHGIRWWSGFWGDWRTVVLFTARMSRDLEFGTPEALTTDHPAVAKAASLLGMSA